MNGTRAERRLPLPPSNGHVPARPGAHPDDPVEQSVAELIKLEHRSRLEMTFSDRIADRITAFSGSMRYAWLHVVWFAAWIVINLGWVGVEPFDPFPFGLLTMIVSLEAIFLSAFVLISQNHADERRQAIADHQWEVIQLEERQMEELLTVTRQILANTKAIQRTTGR